MGIPLPVRVREANAKYSEAKNHTPNEDVPQQHRRCQPMRAVALLQLYDKSIAGG